MTIREQLNSIAEKRIVILDGAMGSLIQVLNLDEKGYRGQLFADHPTPLAGCNDILCLTRPGAIGAIHDTYLEAGADIIETCSFNSTSITLADYGLGHMSYEISVAAAQVAQKSADKFSAYGKKRFVAGSIGPTAKGASLYPDINNPAKRSISWDELELSYYDNARGLLDGGADILLVETIFDTLNAKAALFAINRLIKERQIDLPIIVSAAVSGEAGRLLSGQNLEAFCTSVQHVKPWAIGLNCSFDATKLLPHVRLLSKIAPCYVSAYPNAGLPNKFGRYDEIPELMAAHIEPYFEEKLVNIIGGCCGTTPAHIAAIREKASDFIPRKVNDTGNKYFSGLELFDPQGSIIRIKNTNFSAEKEEMQKSLAEGEYEDATDTARDMIDNGCEILDIQIDDEKALNSFLDYALMNPYIAKAPFFINSQDTATLESGLKRLQGRCLAGYISLKDGESMFLQKVQLIRSYGAAAVISLSAQSSLSAQGSLSVQSSLSVQGSLSVLDGEQKIDIAERVYKLLISSGYPADNIVLEPFAEGEDDFIISQIQKNCPGVFIAL